MISDYVHSSANDAAIARMVQAAIFEAREVYEDRNWKDWADRWIDGRDRSFASARIAHDQAREARRREISDGSAREDLSGVWGTSMDSPAESAAWAAGLALVTASIAPDPKAAIMRVLESAWERIAAALGMRNVTLPRLGWTRKASNFA
jgi:hypothetical protein